MTTQVTQLVLPNFEQKLNVQGVTQIPWYRFWQGLWQGLPPAVETGVTVAPTPFRYTAPSRGFLIVQGGTVSLIQFTRDANINYTTGQTAGCFPLSFGDTLIITYTVTPTVTFVPQ